MNAQKSDIVFALNAKYSEVPGQQSPPPKSEGIYSIMFFVVLQW